MKKISKLLIIALVVAMTISCFGCAKQDEPVTPTEAPATDAPTAEPTEEPTDTPTAEPTDTPAPTATPDPYLHYEYTMTTVFDFAEREDKETAIVKEDLGWPFGSDVTTYAIKDKKVVCSNIDTEDETRVRLDKSIEISPSVELTDANNALAIYVENNSDTPMGFCFFGELSVPAMEGEHQSVYNSTPFDEIESYLIDADGNMTAGTEYEAENSSFMDKGFVELPAHFKGYYVVTFETMGHDCCYYGSWGYHDTSICQNALYEKGSTIVNPGFAFYKEEADAADTVVVGEYCYLNITK